MSPILLPPSLLVPQSGIGGIDAYTVAMLHGNGSDGSTTITDETGKAWTARGNAQIDTAQSVFGGASILFDGTGDSVDTPDHADWQLDGGSNSNEWTIDFRVRYNGAPAGIKGLVEQRSNSSNFWAIFNNFGNLTFQVKSAGTDIVFISNAWSPSSVTWYHVAVVKQGTTGYKFFIDGTQIGSTQTDTSTIPDFGAVLSIGTQDAANYMNGWMDEFRLSKGVARWTANFTPPIAEYST